MIVRYLAPLIAGLVALIAAVLVSIPAPAQDDWIRPALRESARFNCEWWGNCQQWYRYQRWRQRAAHLRRHSRDWARDGESWRAGRQCYDRVIEVLSGPHKIEEAALTDAWKRWMSEVQFERGSVFMEPENSINRRWLCSIVDPGEGWASTVSRIGGRIANITRGKAPNASDGRSVRCKIWARPCREAPERPEDGERGVRR